MLMILMSLSYISTVILAVDMSLSSYGEILTLCGRMTPYGDINLGQHWLMYWLGAVRQQAITWASVDFSPARFCGIHMRGLKLRVSTLIV